MQIPTSDMALGVPLCLRACGPATQAGEKLPQPGPSTGGVLSPDQRSQSGGLTPHCSWLRAQALCLPLGVPKLGPATGQANTKELAHWKLLEAKQGILWVPHLPQELD